jgi:hypothetical protein
MAGVGRFRPYARPFASQAVPVPIGRYAYLLPGTCNEYYRLRAVFLAGARLGLRRAGAFFFFAAFGAASFATA